MPLYQHLLKNDVWLVSKPSSKVSSTEPWSTVEQASPFEITETNVDAVETDTQVEVKTGVSVWVSQIDMRLLPPQDPEQ